MYIRRYIYIYICIYALTGQVCNCFLVPVKTGRRNRAILYSLCVPHLTTAHALKTISRDAASVSRLVRPQRLGTKGFTGNTEYKFALLSQPVFTDTRKKL